MELKEGVVRNEEEESGGREGSRKNLKERGCGNGGGRRKWKRG